MKTVNTARSFHCSKTCFNAQGLKFVVRIAISGDVSNSRTPGKLDRSHSDTENESEGQHCPSLTSQN
jgi:hypothetical protein